MPRIDDLPDALRSIARRVDSSPGIGNADGEVDKAELNALRAALSRGAVSAFTSDEMSALARLEAALVAPVPETEAGAETRAVGPGGIYQSTLYPPKDGFQREVIRFETPANPAGLALSGGVPLELDASLGGEGVVGVRTEPSYPSASRVDIRIGGIEVPAKTTPPPPGTQPLHGKLTLTSAEPLTLRSIEVLHQVPSPLEDTDYYPLNRTVRAGETVELDLSRYRRGKGLEQIEAIWSGSYSVPDPSGRKSDEGKPFYLDGVYADLFLVDEAGNETQVDRTKFVDANEVDNSHDLPGPKGSKLRVKFFARDPAGEGHPITFTGVRFKYKPESSSTPPATFTVGKIFNPGERCEVELPPELRNRRIGRIEVRWTDMLSGTWTRPGYSYGTLLIDGRPVGAAESVQSPETQSFSFLGGARATGGKVGVLIDRDRAQVDWIKVYFEDEPSTPVTSADVASPVADVSGDLSRLNDTQRAVLRDTAARAATHSAAAHAALLEKVKGLGFGEEALKTCLEYIRTKAPITINFNPDKRVADTSAPVGPDYWSVTEDPSGRRLIDALLADGSYRNQFETRNTSGSFAPYEGGCRDGWEKTIFAGGYHGHPLIPQERPKYGALNAVRDTNGGAASYGRCYFVLKDGVRGRTTFTPRNSSGCKENEVGTVDHFEHVLNAQDVAALVDIALGRRRRASLGWFGGAYIEAQVHGPVEFDKDVAAVVVNTMFRGTEYETKLREFARKYRVPLQWTDGERVTDDAGNVIE